jgi:hydroxymethylpyrimidine pyrophosphatase-like HAD family hydrolase
LGLPEGYDLPIVSCQGAAAQTYLSQKELHRAEIPKDTAVALLKRTAALGLYTQLYINGVIRAAGDNEFLRYYTAKMRGAPYELVGELVAFMQKSEALPEKILCVVDKSLARGIVETLSREFAGRVKVVSSIPVFVESVSINAGKDMAIESVLKAYGYTLQDAVICGDNYNDIDMVRRAGLGVAVANAEPALKAVARYVTESNDQEGVAHAARKFCIGF